jgi:hypothetical protein
MQRIWDLLRDSILFNHDVQNRHILDSLEKAQLATVHLHVVLRVTDRRRCYADLDWLSRQHDSRSDNTKLRNRTSYIYSHILLGFVLHNLDVCLVHGLLGTMFVYCREFATGNVVSATHPISTEDAIKGQQHAAV